MLWQCVDSYYGGVKWRLQLMLKMTHTFTSVSIINLLRSIGYNVNLIIWEGGTYFNMLTKWYRIYKLIL